MIRLWKYMNSKRVIQIFFLIVLEAITFLSLPSLAANIINDGIIPGDTQTIIKLGALMIAFSFISILIAAVNVRLSAQETQEMGNKIRKDIFKKIMHFSSADMAQFGASTLMTRTTNDVMQLQFVTMLSMRLAFMSPMVIIVSTVLAYLREDRLAFIFAITLPLIILALALIFRWAMPYFRQIQTKLDKLNQVFREGLTGIRVIRAFNTTDYETKRFDEANSDYRDNAIMAFSINNLMLPSFISILGVSNILIFVFGTRLIAQGQTEVGNLIAFVNYGFQIIFSVINLAMITMMVPRAQISSERIIEVLDAPVTVEEADHAKSLPANSELTLEFKDVSYEFPGAEKPAICQINFKAQAGETLAIIGGTGSGKTTIANLIPRLYDPSQGKVLLNGIDIRQLGLEDLRGRIGFATQKAVLFSGTIRSNLLYGNPEASEEMMWRALEIAQGLEFVERLDDGLDSIVEQGGVNFSGGQRQRLSIARAVISQPDIYLFDDSFSALDFQTDAKLRQALKPATQDAINIIIAQRVNTVIDADRIIVLDNGQIVGMGSHQELKANNDVYRDIVKSQMKGEDI
ncbi:ABC transporter ATP-binding protein [Hutsoniella sourekii]|uniref:ABC transporter ATP-binding protein n=1 Tax=Hutsoniella sourekii TaxID=87650 RepID=UPI000487D31A|nr:ABC transporter ATP-binding protein [Hutsoniella sourekii]